MKGKIALVIGATAGYVLGTRDGRQRYEEIKTKAENFWHDPKVQEKVQEKVAQAKQAVNSANGDSSTSPAADTESISGEPASATPGGAQNG